MPSSTRKPNTSDSRPDLLGRDEARGVAQGRADVFLGNLVLIDHLSVRHPAGQRRDDELDGPAAPSSAA